MAGGTPCHFARIGLLGLAAACADPSVDPGLPLEARISEDVAGNAGEPISPLPLRLELDPERVHLGQRLFEEPLLSGSGERACTDCHTLGEGGIVPFERRSNHPVNPTGPYNVPTVFNVAFSFRYNWNGRWLTLEDHLGGLMMKPEVMDAGSWDELAGRLRPTYQSAFVSAGYEGGVTEASIRDAMSTYQRSLVTPNARFDRYLRHELDLTSEEREGYEIFQAVGCVGCHQGINVGGNLFQRFGVMDDAFGGRELRESDFGRFLLTGREEDAFVFRVPSLRNVEVTAPYFHDGSADTLEEAIQHMGRVQLGHMLTAEEITRIAAFLRTLTGEHDGTRLAVPREGA